MKRKIIKCIVASLAIIASVSYIPAKASTHISASSNIIDVSSNHKDKCDCEEKKTDKKDKHDDSDCKEKIEKKDDCQKNYDKNMIFNKENEKYLTKDQCKQWKEIKSCNDKGEKLTAEQEEFLNTVMDCIIKGKLGDKNYKEFKELTTKKQNKENLTNEEKKKLKEYKDMISSSKPTVHEFLHDFLR